MIELLGTEWPIIQSPMAGVATPALAAAVSEAGGLGSLGIGASNADQARQAIVETRALTARPFNVNVFCNQPPQRNKVLEDAWLRHLWPLFRELGAAPPTELNEIYETFLTDSATFRMLLDQRPAIVSFHFGLPAPEKIAAFRAEGIKMLATATNLAEARKIEAAGIDGIVAQGIEAGGHRGMFDPTAVDERLSTAVLVRLLVKNTRLPVIAAGGIMDGAGIRAALALGATAAQLGTAFILCPESSASVGYRQMLRSERSEVTRLTPVVSGRPARGIVNRLILHGEAAGGSAAADYPLAYDAAKQINAAAAALGSHEFAAHWAGQGAPLVRELSASALVRELIEELQAAGH